MHTARRASSSAGIADGLSISLGLGSSLSATALASIRAALPAASVGTGLAQRDMLFPETTGETPLTIVEGLQRGVQRLRLNFMGIVQGKPEAELICWVTHSARELAHDWQSSVGLLILGSLPERSRNT